jgi:hypothetical protein
MVSYSARMSSFEPTAAVGRHRLNDDAPPSSVVTSSFVSFVILRSPRMGLSMTTPYPLPIISKAHMSDSRLPLGPRPDG